METVTQTDEIERAHKWFFLVRMAFSGFFGKTGASFAYQRNFAQQLANAVADFEIVFDRLRHVQIENDIWEIVIERYDSPDTMFYLDPPYIHATRSDGEYQHEMTDADHNRLVDMLLGVQGKVLLSGYDHEIYERLGWDKTSFETSCFSAQWSSNGEPSKLKRTESLWRNYEIQPTLW